MTFFTNLLNINIPKDHAVVEIFNLYDNTYDLILLNNKVFNQMSGKQSHDYLSAFKTVNSMVKKAKIKDETEITYVYIYWEEVVYDFMRQHNLGYYDANCFEKIRDFKNFYQNMPNNIKSLFVTELSKNVKQRSFQDVSNLY